MQLTGGAMKRARNAGIHGSSEGTSSEQTSSGHAGTSPAPEASTSQSAAGS